MDDRSLDAIRDELQRDAVRRSASVGPLAAMAHLLRRIIQLVQDLLALVAELPLQLELIDARMRRTYGERWWDEFFDARHRRDLDDFYDRP